MFQPCRLWLHDRKRNNDFWLHHFPDNICSKHILPAEMFKFSMISHTIKNQISTLSWTCASFPAVWLLHKNDRHARGGYVGCALLFIKKSDCFSKRVKFPWSTSFWIIWDAWSTVDVKFLSKNIERSWAIGEISWNSAQPVLSSLAVKYDDTINKVAARSTSKDCQFFARDSLWIIGLTRHLSQSSVSGHAWFNQA